jgi:hypothetical protein
VADKSSYSVAPGDASRSRVLSLGALLALVLLSLVGLALVFPREDLFNRLRSDSANTDPALTVAYLRNIVRVERTDTDLRLLLAEKLAAQRDFDGAMQALTEAQAHLQTPAQRQNWEQARAMLLWRQYEDERAGKPAGERAAYDAQMTPALLAQVAQVQQASRLMALVDVSIRSENKALLKALLERAGQLRTVTFTELGNAAKVALGQGLFSTSAQLYFAARDKLADSEARNRMAMLGVKSLLAGGDPVAAFEAARSKLDALSPQGPLRWDLLRLGLGAGRSSDVAGMLQLMMPADLSAQELATRFTADQLELARAVFLGTTQPRQALRVVQAQRVQQPGDRALAEMQAQLSEWSGDPARAMALWRELMQAGYGEKALDAVFRLGPSLGDDETLLMAWRARARQRALSVTEVGQVVAVYEHMGLPGKALVWLDEAGARSGMASQRAALLERMGRSAEAARTLLDARGKGEPWSRDDAMRVARGLANQGRFEEGTAALLSWAGSDDARQPRQDLGLLATDSEALDFLGDMAWESGQEGVALQAYRQLWQVARHSKEELPREYQVERMMRTLMSGHQWQQARELAAEIYPRLRSNALVLWWMDSLQVQGDGKSDVSLLKARLKDWARQLDAQHLARLENDPLFLARRAGLYAQVGEIRQALADYRASLARQRQADVETSYWWLLIDRGERQLLRDEVLPRLGAVRLLPQYQEVLGASFIALEEPRRAAEFYHRQARERSKDYLWLVNYADVLDQVGKNQLAARVRQHAWGLVRTQLRGMKAPDQERAMEALLVRMRLSEPLASGSEKERLSRFLAQAWRKGQLNAQQARQYEDLVVSWALAGERHELARQWLLRQRVLKAAGPAPQLATAQAAPTPTTGDAQLPRPDSQGELAFALATRDKPTLQELLRAADAGRFRMHSYDRLQAYRILGRTEDAVTLAVQLAQRAGEGGLHESEQEAMEADLLKLASRASGTWETRNMGGVLSQRGLDARASVALGDGWRLLARRSDQALQTLNPAVLAAVPARNRSHAVGVSHEQGATQWQAQLTQQSALATLSGLLLRLSHALDPRRNVIVELGLRQSTDESAALAAAGVADRLSLQWTQQLSKELSLDARWAVKRYATQNRVPLGSGQDYAANLTWQIHGQRPQWQARLGVRRSMQNIGTQTDPLATFMNPAGVAPGGSFFLAPGSSALSLSLGYNLPEAMDVPGAYSRALRPWAEVGVEQSRSAGVSGSTGVLRAGVRGSVLGRDQLVLGLDIRPQRSGGSTRAAQVQYEWIGDR